jgi:hypothetical protein
MELFNEPRLAQPRVAHDQHKLAFARPGALPAARKQAQFLLAANEGVSARAPPLRRPPLARTMRKSWTGLVTPLSSCAPRSSATNSPADIVTGTRFYWLILAREQQPGSTISMAWFFG